MQDHLFILTILYMHLYAMATKWMGIIILISVGEEQVTDGI